MIGLASRNSRVRDFGDCHRWRRRGRSQVLAFLWVFRAFVGVMRLMKEALIRVESMPGRSRWKELMTGA